MRRRKTRQVLKEQKQQALQAPLPPSPGRVSSSNQDKLSEKDKQKIAQMKAQINFNQKEGDKVRSEALKKVADAHKENLEADLKQRAAGEERLANFLKSLGYGGAGISTP